MINFSIQGQLLGNRIFLFVFLLFSILFSGCFREDDLFENTVSKMHDMSLSEEGETSSILVKRKKKCKDLTGPDGGKWYDSKDSKYNCKWYSRKDNCSEYGDSYENFGYTANEACCACGGGDDGSEKTVCGNGVKEAGETCDDGNSNGQPGQCNSTCSDYLDARCESWCANHKNSEGVTTWELRCTWEACGACSACDSVCGNGVVEVGETCDDGNSNGQVGKCNSTCSGDTSENTNGTFYISAKRGNDSNDGRSPERAWKTLAHASTQSFTPGQKLLLKRGEVFKGKLLFDGQNGTASSPIVIGAYGSGSAPRIDATGYLAGVHIATSNHIVVRDLEITADGGATVDGSDAKLRYGVLVKPAWGVETTGITIKNLHIHDIYPEVGVDKKGATTISYLGTAIAIRGSGNTNGEYPLSNMIVEGCTIERTGYKAIELNRVNFTELLNNTMNNIGGPAIQPGRCKDLVVRGNTVNKSGSFIDPRMHGRGSGIWPWSCERVLIEKNTFKGARGHTDSCGAHIDFNNTDVIIQYNLSVDNAGGFIEILGNNHNCTYRYNISINDGGRVKGEVDQGTKRNSFHGMIIYISGFVGNTDGVVNDHVGPSNTYIYGNTIYVKPGQASHFVINGTTDGLLISNNIFYLGGPIGNELKGWVVNGSKTTSYKQAMINSVVWKNNLYENADSMPLHLPFKDVSPRIGNPGFVRIGGFNANDYVPTRMNTVVDKGIVINKLPGDKIGINSIYGGLDITEDYLGNTIINRPDFGAIEVGTGSTPADRCENWCANHKNSQGVTTWELRCTWEACGACLACE